VLPILADAAPNPYQIFERAEAFWFSQHYPAYLTYDVAVRVTQGSTVKVERYTSAFDGVNNMVYVDPVSDYELAHPVVPHGINVNILGFSVSKPLPPIDFMGVPLLSPTYSFGMAPFIPAQPPDSDEARRALVTQIRKEFHDPYARGRTPPPDDSGGLRTIAHQVAAGGVYVISFDGIENLNGHSCYHLSLRPRSDPGRYRLRELWVDASTYATWRLYEALNFKDGPGTTVPWTVDFDNIGGVQYVAQEHAGEPVHYMSQTYDDVAVGFEAVRPATFLPNDVQLNFGSGDVRCLGGPPGGCVQTMREPL
jgi:hypothetical protein